MKQPIRYLGRGASKETAMEHAKKKNHRWRNRGGRMGLGAPTFISGGPVPPRFCLNITNLSNTVSIGSSDKVNRLMKKR